MEKKYAKPTLTNLPKPLYDRIYSTIVNTPYPDYAAIAKKAEESRKQLEQYLRKEHGR